MSDFPALKDQINITLISQLADRIGAIYTDFARQSFIQAVDVEIHKLELKPRFGLIADKLYEFLPAHYPTAVQILVDVLDDKKHAFDHIEDVGFRLLAIPTYIEKYGTDHLHESFNAMYIITRYVSCEFAIRPFIIKYPQQTLDILATWARDDNEHVRRLVSEGSRPRLPWAPQLPDFIADPSPMLAILHHLQDDPSLYVRRSVANHLNDITKDHPELVMNTLEVWQKEASEGTHWLINHALRTLIKKGHPRALEILGFGVSAVELCELDISPKQLVFGETLVIELQLKNGDSAPQSLMIDYVMHFVKANGKTAPKVFKLRKATLNANEILTIRKTHAIRPISTRKYYGGQHRIEIQVNGQIVGGADFELIMPE